MSREARSVLNEEALSGPETAETPSSAAPASPPSITSLLVEARDRASKILERMPETLAEARQLISRELWPLPRPEELQAIVKIAGDAHAEGPRREVPRRLIALRLVADALCQRFWDGATTDPAVIRELAGALREILDSVEVYTASVASPSPLRSEDQDYLRQIVKALSPPPEPLLAAVTLAPWLAGLLEVPHEEALNVIPSLTDDEAGLLVPEAGLEDAPFRALGRACLDVAAARWLMHEDLAAWEAVRPRAAVTGSQPAQAEKPPAGSPDVQGASGSSAPGPSAGGGPIEDPGLRDGAAALAASEAMQSGAPPSPSTRAPDGDQRGAAAAGLREGGSEEDRRAEEQEALRTKVRRRVWEHEATFRFVSDRLQKLQDTAVIAREKETIDWLGRFRKPLMASYRRIGPLLIKGRGGQGPERLDQEDTGGGAEDADHPPIREIYENAASSLQSQEPAPLPGYDEPASRARAQRKRLILSGALTVVLTGIAILVHAILPPPPPRPIDVSPSDFANAVSLSATQSVGTMLYARVSSSWAELSDSERAREVGALARLATERGFDAIHLVDDAGEPVADWDLSRGPRLRTAAP